MTRAGATGAAGQGPPASQPQRRTGTRWAQPSAGGAATLELACRRILGSTTRRHGPQAEAPRARRGRLARSVRLHAQHALHDLGLRRLLAADVGEPAVVARAVIHAVERARDAAGQGQGDLRAESRCQVDGVLDVVAPPLRQRQVAEVGVGLLQVGHWRHDLVLEDLDADDVLDPHAHRVAGEALGVRDDDAVGNGPEDLAQGRDLRGRAAAASRGVGLVRHEDRLRCHRLPVDAEAALRGRHEALDDARHVPHVEAGRVEGAVAGLGGEQLHDPAHAALLDRVLALHHEGARPHADERPVAAPVEREGGVLDALVGRAGPARDEAGPHPLDQGVARRRCRRPPRPRADSDPTGSSPRRGRCPTPSRRRPRSRGCSARGPRCTRRTGCDPS